MKRLYFLLIAACTWSYAGLAQHSTPNDGDWLKHNATLSNTPEADFMVRLGDIDNLGFLFEEEFDPFCGRTYAPHFFPWDIHPEDVKGLDCIIKGSKFTPSGEYPCGADGYSSGESFSRPVPYILNTGGASSITIRDAWLQIFIDDFQAPVFCSKFNVTLNGTRFVEAEKILNVIEQTGPVGKLVTFRIPEEFYPAIQSGKLTLFIDDVQGSGDSWGIDFLKLIVNRKTEKICRGDITGYVLDDETSEPIKGALVSGPEGKTAVTDGNGQFRLSQLPTGLEIISAHGEGYEDGSGPADIAEGTDNAEVVIRLKKSKGTVKFNNQDIRAGESIVLNNILFDQGSAALRPESKTELDKLAAFLQVNPTVEIELSGHTSSEGDAALNRSLSYKRVKSCKDYLLTKGIDTGRITTVGYGPDRPVAGNDTEAGRAQNRRVEMRVVKI